MKQQCSYSKGRSHEMLNKSSPKIEPCGTPDMFSHVLKDSEGKLDSFSKKEVTIHKYVVLQVVNHGKYNKMLSIGQ